MLLLYICYKGVASEIGGELLLALMDGLTDEFWQDPLWTVMFIDDIVICGESNEQVEDNLEEGGGGVYTSVNEREVWRKSSRSRYGDGCRRRFVTLAA